MDILHDNAHTPTAVGALPIPKTGCESLVQVSRACPARFLWSSSVGLFVPGRPLSVCLRVCLSVPVRIVFCLKANSVFYRFSGPASVHSCSDRLLLVAGERGMPPKIVMLMEIYKLLSNKDQMLLLTRFGLKLELLKVHRHPAGSPRPCALPCEPRPQYGAEMLLQERKQSRRTTGCSCLGRCATCRPGD